MKKVERFKPGVTETYYKFYEVKEVGPDKEKTKPKQGPESESKPGHSLGPKKGPKTGSRQGPESGPSQGPSQGPKPAPKPKPAHLVRQGSQSPEYQIEEIKNEEIKEVTETKRYDEVKNETVVERIEIEEKTETKTMSPATKRRDLAKAFDVELADAVKRFQRSDLDEEIIEKTFESIQILEEERGGDAEAEDSKDVMKDGENSDAKDAKDGKDAENEIFVLVEVKDEDEDADAARVIPIPSRRKSLEVPKQPSEIVEHTIVKEITEVRNIHEVPRRAPERAREVSTVEIAIQTMSENIMNETLIKSEIEIERETERVATLQQGPSGLEWHYRAESSGRMAGLLRSNRMADITFIVGKEGRKISAHRTVLASASAVFAEMFYGTTSVDEEVRLIEIPDEDADAFELLVMYIYGGECLKDPRVLLKTQELFEVAVKYRVVDLVDALKEKIFLIIDKNNCLHFLELAEEIGNEDIRERALQVLDANAEFVFANNPQFLKLKRNLLEDVLKRSSLDIKEPILLKYVLRWARVECGRQSLRVTGPNLRLALGDAFYHVRFPLMSRERILKLQDKYDLFSATELKVLSLPRHDETMLDLVHASILAKFRSEPRKATTLPIYARDDIPSLCDSRGTFDTALSTTSSDSLKSIRQEVHPKTIRPCHVHTVSRVPIHYQFWIQYVDYKYWVNQTWHVPFHTNYNNTVVYVQKKYPKVLYLTLTPSMKITVTGFGIYGAKKKGNDKIQVALRFADGQELFREEGVFYSEKITTGKKGHQKLQKYFLGNPFFLTKDQYYSIVIFTGFKPIDRLPMTYFIPFQDILVENEQIVTLKFKQEVFLKGKMVNSLEVPSEIPEFYFTVPQTLDAVE